MAVKWQIRRDLSESFGRALLPLRLGRLGCTEPASSLEQASTDGEERGVARPGTVACVIGMGFAIAGFAVTGCVSIRFSARANTLVQNETEPSMRGRMLGIWNTAAPGTSPITSPMVG